MGGVYNELIKASTNARGLQTEYLATMSAHHSPLPMLELIYKLEIDTFSIQFNFRQISPQHSWWEKIKIHLHLMAPLPSGVYLVLCSQQESTMSLSVTLNEATAGKLLTEPELNSPPAYYVVTKIG